MKRLRGFSLIEILISLLILGVGILGMMGLQNHALKANVNAEQMTRAMLVLDSLEEDMQQFSQTSKGTEICAANALDTYNLQVAQVDAAANLTFAGENAPCPTSTNNGINTFRFELTWTAVGSQTTGENAPANRTVTREVRM